MISRLVANFISQLLESMLQSRPQVTFPPIGLPYLPLTPCHIKRLSIAHIFSHILLQAFVLLTLSLSSIDMYDNDVGKKSAINL